MAKPTGTGEFTGKRGDFFWKAVRRDEVTCSAETNSGPNEYAGDGVERGGDPGRKGWTVCLAGDPADPSLKLFDWPNKNKSPRPPQNI